MFASLTAHTTAMMPMMLAAGMGIPGLSAATLAMADGRDHALGHRPRLRQGTIFGLIFLGAPLLAIG
jgi:hypothetical protein